MTGFGQAEFKFPQGTIRVELKSTNHKFLEISSRLPGHLAGHEEALRRQVSRRLSRGKVLLFVACPDPAVFSSRLALNEALAKEVFHKTRSVRKLLKLKNVSEDAMLREVLRYPDVLVKDADAGKGVGPIRQVSRVLDQALKDLDRSREAEGRALRADLRSRLSEIRRSLGAIERRLPALTKEFRKNLETRAKGFLKDGGVDRDRLTQEVAQYLKNSDISEEVTRLKSHLKGLEKTLAEKGEIGRKIDFIAQELTREANTIGAKSNDVALADRVIAIKSSIEKIREQAQNVE